MTRLLDLDGVCLEAGPEGLVVNGDVDFAIAASLVQAGSDWLGQQPAGTRVTLDLGGVGRISSAALSMLLEWTRQARSAGIEIGGVRLSPPLLRLTRLAGLDALLPIVATPGT